MRDGNRQGPGGSFPPGWRAARSGPPRGLRALGAGRMQAFTLIELVIVVAIVVTLTVLASAAYSNYREDALNKRTTVEIRSIEGRIEQYKFDNGDLPDSLADMGTSAPLDPWGNPYGYLKLAGAPAGAARKDKFLVPLNTDYDLYSKGPDGASSAPLTASASQDDIVRANNGAFVGLATDY